MADFSTDFEKDDIDEARSAKVEQLITMVKEDAEHWEYAFKRMREWRNFARGIQWPGTSKAELSDADRNYVANITMRHLKQRTSSVYAKNPSYLWRRSQRLNRRFWDGTAAQLQMAQMMMSPVDPQTGQPRQIDPQQAAYWQSVIMDAMQSRGENQVTERMGETLSNLYSYFIREQTPPTKAMMKKQVLTSFTTGVTYFKQTFQRATDYPPDVSRQIADQMAQIQKLERLSSDLETGEIDQYAPEMDELRLMMQALEQTPQIVLREGLTIDYPDSLNIIPDRGMTHLQGFVGCSHVSEQYNLSRDEILEIYGIDTKGKMTEYRGSETEALRAGHVSQGSEGQERVTGRVFEIWDRADGLVYTVCEGYHDYLVEPHAPVTYTERFWPWFVYAPNAVDDPDDPFPPSDVELIMPMQMEINRAGEALRQHRYAARPGWVSGSAISDEDVKKIEGRRAHGLTLLNSLQPDEDVRAKFQAFPTSNIDMNLYQTNTPFTDILRSVGTQEANLGGTSGATATESSIAESSRQSTLGSAIDEFDDLLTEMARQGGQLLMLEMSEEKVKEIVGPGAVWPQSDPETVAREIQLEVVAGSSGRPNQSQEVAVMERLFPLLFQIPGIKHEMLMQHGVRVLDDTIAYEDWIDMDALPITAFNGGLQATANRGGQGGGAPQAQQGGGGQGQQGNQGQGGSANQPAPPAAPPGGMARPGQPGFGPQGG